MTTLIGITSKNRVGILPKSIQSALDQSYKDKFIEVFDDASTDGTEKLVEKYPDVTWHLSPATVGYLYARNLFLNNKKAKYFVSLDDDAWFLNKDALALAIEYLESHKDVAAIAFDILSPDEGVESDYLNDIKIQPVETNLFIGCGHILNRSIANSLGNFIANPGYYGGEEKDLCIRIIDAGYKIIKLQGLYVWHDKTNLSRDIKKQHRSGVCNDLVFTLRRFPLVVLISALPYKILSHLIFSLRYKKEKLFRVAISGILDFFTFLFSGKVLRKPVKLSTWRKFQSFNKKI